MKHIAHPAIRNRGTLGGSIALADPAAEYPACMVALDATIIVAGREGERLIRAEDFFKGLFEVDLRPGELVTAVEFVAMLKDERCVFLELARRHGDYAIIGLAAYKGATTRFVFFGAGATPVFAKAASRAASLDGSETRARAGARAAGRSLHQLGHQAASRQGASGTRMEHALDITLTVNGTQVSRRVPARQHLVDFLREELGLTGSHIGCEHGVCGACTVRVDGEIVRGCLMLAVQADGCRVDTIEGLTDSEELARPAEGVPRAECASVRLLHARHADGGAGPAQAAQESEPRRDPRAHLRQLLPLHRLPGDRRRHRRGV